MRSSRNGETPSAQPMDTDDERLRVQDAEAALATEQKGVTSKTEEYRWQGGRCPSQSASESDKAILDAISALLGGTSDVARRYGQQLAMLPSCFSQCLYLETEGGGIPT